MQILYIQDPKDATRKLLELINEFGKVAGYKINAQESLAFLYTNDEKSEREIKETLPFTIATKEIKYLGINLPKETKDLYAENYKTLMKESKDDKTDGEIYHVLGLEESTCEIDCTTQSKQQIQSNPHQNINGIFHITRTNNLKICMET